MKINNLRFFELSLTGSRSWQDDEHYPSKLVQKCIYVTNSKYKTESKHSLWERALFQNAPSVTEAIWRVLRSVVQWSMELLKHLVALWEITTAGRTI